VAKTVRSPLVDLDNGQLAYTHVIVDGDLDLLDDLRLAPAIFQEFVPKSYEVRITCVGTTTVPVAIYSQEHSGAAEDWRRVPYPELRHAVIDLPVRVEKACLDLMARFKLNFAAFDFIVTPSGEWIFLECNPNGEWAWMEEVSGYPIGRRLAELLVLGD
jgi:glutathione synthase/RimK-type ligase-like ATP-grasp enzyme